MSIITTSDDKPSDNPNNNHRRSNPSTQVKLPKLELPKFNGDPTSWVPFRDTYKALVHDVANVTSIQKFSYLKASITDKFSPISHLAISDDGYDDAWQSVLKFYNNDRRIADAHMQALFSKRVMQQESADDLTSIINIYSSNIDCIKRIIPNEERFESVIAFLALYRLDEHTKELFEADCETQLPLWTDLKTFLEKRRKVLENINLNKPKKSQGVIRTKQGFSSSHSNVAASSAFNGDSIPKCKLCKEREHYLSKCSRFIAMTPQCRQQSDKTLGNCFNCLGIHSKGMKCSSRRTCNECRKPHHTLLHFPTRVDVKEPQAAHPIDSDITMNSNSNTFNLFSSLDNPSCKIWLSTAIVLIRSHYGQWFSARALLDSASHSNYMTKRLADQLQLKQDSVKVITKGMGGKSLSIDRSTTTLISSFDNNFESSASFLITKDITGILPSQSETFNRSSLPSKLPLADDQFDVPSSVDMLLGTSIFWSLIKSNRMQLENGAILIETVFGWIVSGEATNHALHNDDSDRLCHLSTLDSLKSSVEQFWKTEDYRNDKRFLTEEECDVESHFERTYQRKPDGRFMVNLPITNKIDSLCNNYNQAFAQFIANEKRLLKHERLQTATQDFMKEYINLGHMSLIDISGESPNALAYYLPHHAVEKPESTTTSVRVVFNGSAKTKSGLSFNDVQLVGPKVQPDLLQIQLNFRLHVVVIKADIAKMYRQVEIIPEQRKFQRILWRENPKQNIQVYELNTITYGTASASYQSTRCLKQLSIDFKESHPEASH